MDDERSLILSFNVWILTRIGYMLMLYAV